MKEANVQKNTVYSVIKSAAAILFPLISFPYASRVLLTEGVGKINFGNSVISYFSLIATLGISTYAIRECARVRHDRNALSETASQLYSINLLTTLVSYVLLALTLVVVDRLDEYRLLIIVQSSIIMFTTLGADWLNAAMEDFKFVTLRTVLFQVLALAGMFLFVHSPDDYMIYAVINVVSASGANIVNIFYRRRYCKIGITKTLNLKRHLPSILLMFSLLLSQTVYINSDVTIIGFFRGDHEVGLYSTAVKIYTIVNTMVASVATVLMPKLSYQYARQDYKEINSLLRYGLGFIVTLGLPCLVGINALCGEIIHVLAGDAYMEAVPALHILTISLAASFAGGFVGNLILIPSSREGICLRTSLVSAGVNLALNVILIPLVGFVAAAATTAIAEITSFVIAVRYVEPQIKLGNLKSILLAPVIGCVLIVVAVIAVRCLVQTILLRVIISVAVSVIVYAATLLLMKQEFIMNLLRKAGT